MTTGWLLLVAVLSFQSVDCQITPGLHVDKQTTPGLHADSPTTPGLQKPCDAVRLTAFKNDIMMLLDNRLQAMMTSITTAIKNELNQSNEMKRDMNIAVAINAIKNDVNQLTSHVQTFVDNQQPVLQFLHNSLTTLSRLNITAIKSEIQQLNDTRRDLQTLSENQQSLIELLRQNLTAMNRLDITAIKSDVEQLSDLRRDMQTSLDNQQQLLQLLRENQTATSCLDVTTLLQLRSMRKYTQTLLSNQHQLIQSLNQSANINDDGKLIRGMQNDIQTVMENQQQILRLLHRNQSSDVEKLFTTASPHESSDIYDSSSEDVTEKSTTTTTTPAKPCDCSAICNSTARLDDVTEKSITMPEKPRDCYDIYNSSQSTDGVYTVYIGSSQRPVQVYCDMTTDGGGWTVFQRRQDGTVNFYRNWNDYRTGFGNLTGEFWLGNENLHLLTFNTRQQLRVDLADFEGNTRYAEYDNFKVLSAPTKFTLASLGRYGGSAGDSLRYHLGRQFSTRDQDNDAWSSGSCAVLSKGGWWYNNCHNSNLNGHYYHTGSYTSTYDDGVVWYHWKGYWYSLRFTEMKIRPFSASTE